MVSCPYPYIDVLLCALVWQAKPIPSSLPTHYHGHSPISPCEAFRAWLKPKCEDVTMFLSLKKNRIKF